jgi:ABC-type antimicrobial peptide transport system permease subunit
MKILFANHIHIARQSIASSRMRSILTMLGVTIGVASITTILALSAGANKIVVDQINSLGGNIAVIRPGASTEGTLSGIAELPIGQQYTASTLSNVDITAIENIEHVQAVAPLMILGGSVSGDSEGSPRTPIVVTTPNLQQISNLELSDGQFLDPDLKGATAVIGPQLSIDLYGTDQSIGKTVTVKGQPFTIIGILKRTNMPINYNMVDFDNTVIVDLEDGRALIQGASQIQQINVQSESVEYLGTMITNINKTLLKNHFGQADFTILSGAEIAQPTSSMFTALAGVSVAIAAISLVVGGIGIMNIMLVSVAERTREIGIRKALGATNGDIISQFLIESLALSIGGGITGYIAGYILAFVISTFLTFDPLFNWEIAGTALVVSLVIGTLFGLYPAIRAARKDPISALRQYD